MSEIGRFKPVKLICGLIYSRPEIWAKAIEILPLKFGPIDLESQAFPFNFTDYYEPEMGKDLKRSFLSFQRLIDPERLPEIKVMTNLLEKEFQPFFPELKRPINLDPGYLTSSALIMATTKDFSHRIPLNQGIYAHLELLFTKKGVKLLDWTYPDFRQSEYHIFFQKVREIYLSQLKETKIQTTP
ncbi:MAG: DUF4416 family protein [Candidatus Saccharicenans sp.]|nr:MAG: DUF4416 domain-containing protein [Candidatus Aminicenantes bacterium]HEK85125.1 DUF4416 family protein [Candidatus Aminicenantes bacterium]